jgi:hypothetical protein
MTQGGIGYHKWYYKETDFWDSENLSYPPKSVCGQAKLWSLVVLIPNYMAWFHAGVNRIFSDICTSQSNSRCAPTSEMFQKIWWKNIHEKKKIMISEQNSLGLDPECFPVLPGNTCISSVIPICQLGVALGQTIASIFQVDWRLSW